MFEDRWCNDHLQIHYTLYPEHELRRERSLQAAPVKLVEEVEEQRDVIQRLCVSRRRRHECHERSLHKDQLSR